MKTIKSLRGMRDIFPGKDIEWLIFEKEKNKILKNYSGFEEIRLPIIEKKTLFERTIGHNTDIVKKEMYEFSDRNKKEITLRPEGTSGCLRSIIENKMISDRLKNILKFWYFGPMFRYERPQHGRYRQFYQFGMEIYGSSSCLYEFEIFTFLWSLFKKLKIKDRIILNINNIGTRENQKIYSYNLKKKIKKYYKFFNNNERKQFSTNTLKVLDSKNPIVKDILLDCPKIYDYIDEKSKNSFSNLINFIKLLGIPFVIKDNLVRGIDYYNGNVFEWHDKLSKNAQNTFCAGGRYDSLSNIIGSNYNIDAFGCAVGVDRLILMLKQNNNILLNKEKKDIIFIISKNLTNISDVMFFIYKIRCILFKKYNINSILGNKVKKSLLEKYDIVIFIKIFKSNKDNLFLIHKNKNFNKLKNKNYSCLANLI